MGLYVGEKGLERVVGVGGQRGCGLGGGEVQLGADGYGSRIGRGTSR